MSDADKELNQILDLLLDGQCDAGQAEKLSNLLADNPELADQYIEHVRLHSMLQWHCEPMPPQTTIGQPESIDTSLPTPRGDRRPIIALMLATATALLVVVGLSQFWVNTTVYAVGLVSDATDVIWADSQESYAVGESFRAGKIRTASGRLTLEFNSGATLICDGPGTIDVISDMRVRVARGRIKVQIVESAIGFVVETPDADVVDLGTEFGIAVLDGKHTDVVVFDGEVDVQPNTTKAETPQRLTMGEAVRVDSLGDLQRIVQVNRESKTGAWSTGESSLRNPVIRSIRDNRRGPEERKFYEIIPSGFDEDALAYVDRLHQWNGLSDNGLPPFLIGGDYVKTFNNDKTESDLEIRVVVARPTTIYVLYDDRCPVPSWLSDSFKDTGVDVGRDIISRKQQNASATGVGSGKSVDGMASVWKRQVAKPAEVVLGPVVRGPRGAGSMYGVVAVPEASQPIR